MEAEGSLPHSQQPAACPYPEPHRNSSRPHTISWRPILILSSHQRQRNRGLWPFYRLCGSGFESRQGRIFSPNLSNWLCPPPPQRPIPCSFLGSKGVEAGSWTLGFRLVQRLRMNGAIPPPVLYGLTACTGTSLPLLLSVGLASFFFCGFVTKDPEWICLVPMYATCPAHLTVLSVPLSFPPS
jgi:hypothetical protein